MACEGIIDLSRPIGSERVRSFQPPWRTVFRYRCPVCGTLRRIYASTFIGTRAVPHMGGVYCGASTSTTTQEGS